MADLGNSKIKNTYQLVLQTDTSGNLQNLSGGTPNPFIVNGNLRYVDGTQNNGYVLLSDASGNASWGPVSFSGDVYISGGSIQGTTIELNASSGGTVSVPGLSWSYDKVTDSIATSGLTSNVGIGTTTPNEKLTVSGAISATTDLYIGRNITTTNNLTVNIDTLYGDSATGNVGVGNLNPTHKLTISGNTFLSVILGIGQSIVCSEGDGRIRFDNGATNTALYVGQQLKIVDGAGVTQTVTISSFTNDTVLVLTSPFPGSDIVATAYLYSTPANTNQFAVYSGTNTAFQVSGDKVMSGSTDLLDIFASSGITNQDVYWSANTDGSISPSGLTTSIGLGTSTPNTPLTVVGDISGTTDLYIDGTSLIKGNLGVTGGTYSNILSAQTQHVAGNLGVSGNTYMGGAIAMGTNKITGLGDPTTAQDAVTKNYLGTITGQTYSYQYITTSFDARGDDQEWAYPSQAGPNYYLWSNVDAGTQVPSASTVGTTTIAVDRYDYAAGFVIPLDCILVGFTGNSRMHGFNDTDAGPVIGLFVHGQPTTETTTTINPVMRARASYYDGGNLQSRYLPMGDMDVNYSLNAGDIIYPAAGSNLSAGSSGIIRGSFTIVLKTLITT